MMHALINPDNTIDRIENNIDPKVETKPGYKWLVVETVDVPYDPATQVRTRARVVEKDRVLQTWDVRSKTAEEIDAEKESRLNAYDKLNFAVNLDHENRIRALEGRQAVTAAQYRSALKARL